MFLISFLIALVVSLAITSLMIKAGVSDIPLDRSSHKHATPTCGGVAFIASIGVVVVSYYFQGGFANAISVPLLALIVSVAIMGLMDDIIIAGSTAKFIIMAFMAGASVAVIGPVDSLALGIGEIQVPIWLGYICGAIWISTAMNLINFIDGANGMQALNMGISFAGLLVFSVLMNANGAALLSLAMLAGYLGFAPFNIREHARIFSGDVGAVTAGYVYAIAVLILAKESGNSSAIYIGPLLILPTLTDTVLTVVRRVQSGNNIFKAHNTHLFQKMIRIRGAHLPVSFKYAGVTALNVLIVFCAAQLNFVRNPAFVAVAIIVAIIIYQILHRRAKILDTAPSIN